MSLHLRADPSPLNSMRRDAKKVGLDCLFQNGNPPLFAAGAVVHDTPTLGKLTKNQSEQAVRFFAIRQGEVPATANESALWF